MSDDIIEEIKKEVEEVCSVSDDPVCDQINRVVESLAVRPDLGDVEPMTYSDFTSPSHSYRNFDPHMVTRLLKGVGTERGEMGTESTTLDGMRYIESGRLVKFLEPASVMFQSLDDDERDLFTRRNPDVVEWVSAYNAAAGLNPIIEWRERAGDNLVGGDGRREAENPPLFSRSRGSATRDRSLLMDMATRRRSYRNWTPGEFQEIIDMVQIELTRGMAREIGFRTPQIREEELEFPYPADSKEVARALFERIESGRFNDMMSPLMSMYARFDRDEMRMFSRRNPGLIMWLSVWGESNHLIHKDQLRAHTFPTLGEE